MMYSIYIDESAIHVSIAARLSRLCVPFSKKLNNLLDSLETDARCTTLETAHLSEHVRIKMTSITIVA
jgi:hypothetical protein